MDRLLHGDFWGGIGTFIGSLVAAATFIVATVNRKEIRAWFTSRTQLQKENLLLMQRALVAEEGRFAAERSQRLWKSGAEGADYDMKRMKERLDEVEKIVPKFNALMDFTRLLLRYTVYLEQEALNAGLKLGQRMPDVPDSLAESLAMKAKS